MGYVVVVFAIINTAAILAVGWYLRDLWVSLPTYVGTAIQDEVRKQDDRIEKRLAKTAERSGNSDGLNETSGIAARVKAGVSVRRQ